jgi:hypothetical protein
MPLTTNRRGAVPCNGSVSPTPIQLGRPRLVRGDQVGQDGSKSCVGVASDVLLGSANYLCWRAVADVA